MRLWSTYATQKIYRDDRKQYEKTVRNFVRQQLGLPAAA